MKIYKTQEEIEADIKDKKLFVNDNVTFKCSFSISASLEIRGNINARNIKAWNIEAWNIKAWNISFYALCFTYNNFVCKSIMGRRKSSRYFCLDSEVIVGGKKCLNTP